MERIYNGNYFLGLSTTCYLEGEGGLNNNGIETGNDYNGIIQG